MVTQTRYDRGDIRRLNATNVLRQVRDHSGSSRAQVAKALGLTRATVSSIVVDLIQSGLVKETDYHEGKTGRPGLSLEFNPDSGCLIAVEIDLDRILIILSNAKKEHLARREIVIPLDSPIEDCLTQAEKMVDEAIEQGKTRNMKCYGICVAWAGLVDRESGKLAFGPTSGWQDVHLKERWEPRFKVPVYIENEAHLGAIESRHTGKSKGRRNLIYLSLGFGLAAGVIVDGVLLRGKTGFAGQVGHTHFKDNGIKCNCGNEGCWVTEIGAAAILRKLEKIGIPVETYNDHDNGWIDKVADLADKGDKRVIEVLNVVGKEIGQGLARLVLTFNPSMIVVGGRLSKLLHFSEISIKLGLDEFVLPHMADNLEILISPEGHDPLDGCLEIVLEAVMKNPPVRD